MSTFNRCVLMATAFAICLPSLGFAQYVWLDEKGTKQFTDTPPPPNVPKSRIIKSPKASISLQPTKADSEKPASDEKITKPVTTASQNEDFNKRRAERQEKEAKAQAEAQAAADKAKNCERARAYQQALESGTRIGTTDKNGERSVMDDSQRERELAEARKVTSACSK